VYRGALHHTLEARRRFGILFVIDHQIGKVLVEVAFEIGRKFLDIHTAGFENRDRILVFRQCHQQMFERRIFVVAVVRLRQGAMQTFFEIA
jgi:hypothetical protein